MTSRRSTTGRALRSRGGFTLLELLIATAVASLVLLVINATFFSALRLHDRTHEKIDRDLEAERALGIVRRDLAGILVPGGTLSGQLQTEALGSSSLDAAGDRVTPDIYTSSGRVDGWSSQSEVQMVAYYLQQATDGTDTKTLVRAVTRNLLPVQDTLPEEQPILTGVLSATIAFFDGTDWVESWDSTATSTLPTAIRFSIVLARRDASNQANALPGAPIDLVVPVFVQTSTSATAAQSAATGGT